MSSQFKYSHVSLLILVAVLAGGCAMGPKFHTPAVDMPGGFLGQGVVSQQVTMADLPWWDVFADETLHKLIQTALTNNYDLRIAIKRVDEYQALAAQSRALFFPQIGYQGDVERGRNAYRGNASPGNGQTINPLMLTASATWELDLWGRIRKLDEAAQAQLLATTANRRGVMLTVVCSVAQAYFELLELDLEMAIAKRTTLSFEESLNIFSQKLAGGAASRLETSRAEAAVAQTAALIPDLERQIVIKENQINLLLGRNPGPIPRATTLLDQEAPPDIPAGLPSDLLRRRPDILATEQNLRAANAQIGAAIAQCFPKIGLTTLFGRVSSDLNSFNSDAMTWSIGGNLTGPIFQGGALLAQIRQARAQTEEQSLTYEQTVRTAFQDVANALVTRVKLEDVFTQQARCVRCYIDAVAVSRDRYLAGKASYYEVLEAQQQLFPAENNLALTQLYRMTAVIQLYKALGGGWNLPDEAWSAIP
ncbi:MAG: efflux transporter outer membrane subunit [Kiritimatiellae bacterium]|nr:efflux transporter outer membrane subunit [Kiritimatiellia bacterium]